MRKPFVDEQGELVIPRDCEPKYRWWQRGGQSVMETLEEIGASEAVKARYRNGISGTPDGPPLPSVRKAPAGEMKLQPKLRLVFGEKPKEEK